MIPSYVINEGGIRNTERELTDTLGLDTMGAHIDSDLGLGSSLSHWNGPRGE